MLGAQQGFVGAIEQHHDAFAAAVLGHAEARGQMAVRALDRGNRAAQALGQIQRAGQAVAQQHRELLAADPAHAVVRGGLLHQHLGDLVQRMVADRVAKAVVQRFETVDIEKDRADPRIGRDGFEAALGLLDERAAVLQAGQRIGRGELRQLALEQKVIAPEPVEAEVKHSGSRHADRHDPHPHDDVDVMRARLAEQQRERRRIEERAADEEMRRREPQWRGADRDHHHRRQDPQQRLLDAGDVQREPRHQHQRVSDADRTEDPGRVGAWNRHHQQGEHQRAGEPVGERRGRAVDHIARPDETQERDNRKRHRHRRKWTLVFQRSSMKAIAQTGIGQLLR